MLTENNEYLNQLNEQQREAVVYCDGPQLVIAGAGSGKTRVLTYKIVHLLHNGFRPGGILALTFTNKAAREMRERIAALTGEEVASRLWMGTFHSIFNRILHYHADRLGYKSNFTIYDTGASRSMIKLLVREMGYDEKVYTAAKVHNAISWAKNALISPERYALDKELLKADKQMKCPNIHVLYRMYMDRARTLGVMDFDDLLYYTYELFDKNQDILDSYRERFAYVLVDEYQDTNSAQYHIINQLCRGRDCLTLVGDDAQSIYSFRGANISNILQLRDVYPTLHTSKLEQNYRSTRNIIDAAGSLIAKNRDQIEKKVFSEKSSGSRIRVIEAYTDQEEARLVASGISSMKMSTGDSYEDFVILYRTNAQSRELEEALRTRSIPYRIYGGLSFYQRKEVKDAVSYFQLVVNPDDDEALRRVINTPKRGIGDTTVGKVTATALENNVSMWHVLNNLDLYAADLNLNTRTRGLLNGFTTLISSFVDANDTQRLDAHELAKLIIDRTGLLNEYVSGDTPENVSRRENINELVAAASTFVNDRIEQGRSDIYMADLMSEVSLATDQDSDTDEAAADGITERVTMMTVHAAKGLEFNNVFIVGVEEDLFPSAMSSDTAAGVEEERRLLYVAITRARNNCTMSYTKSRFRNGMKVFPRPSRFLADIDPSYLNVSGTTLGRAASGSRAPRSSYSPAGGNPVNLTALRSSSQPASPRPQNTPRPGAEGCTTHSLDELSPGMEIRHPSFGHGVITEIDTAMADARIRVKFDSDDSSRLLLLKFAKFAII
ncbi:MAG: UvrD-helicase domain-containing protein [Bacteroidales bacterium]|nr:UvrD-helicase domain-containing protein [Bacteroidales bacterium]